MPDRVIAICPKCHGALHTDPDGIRCERCPAEYAYRDGFPDLIVGDRFEDDTNAATCAYETSSNEFLTHNYLLPNFRRRLAGVERPRILSVGCGIGVDVDLLTDSGFDVVGVDNGNRTREWPKRRRPDRLYLANGKALPFEDQTFDLVYCGCVFPHVGVEGDSNRVRQDYIAERFKLACEMIRVLKPGGFIMVSSPNRLFPLDLFHGRDPSQPFPRWNPPTSPFLLSAGDYRRMFGQAGCDRFELLPVTGYWGFLRKRESWKGRLLVWPVRAVFDLVSKETLSFLRGSVMNPWLVMLMRTPARR